MMTFRFKLGVLALLVLGVAPAAEADLGSCRLHCFRNYRLRESMCRMEDQSPTCIRDAQRDYDACMSQCAAENPVPAESSKLTDEVDASRELPVESAPAKPEVTAPAAQ